MNTLSATLLLMFLLNLGTVENGYQISGETIRFVRTAAHKAQEVYVCANFMGWKREHPDWKMTYHPDGYFYLEKGLSEVKTAERSFYEFTFLVDGKLVDADKEAENVIHCAGHGYRYVISW